MGWKTVDRAHPCGVCGKPDWCARSPDGAALCCRRIAEGGEQRTDRSGGTWWLHWADGLGDRPIQPETPISGPSRDPAPPDTLDAVYRDLLRSLRLTGGHRRQLRDRGLSDDEIARVGYASLPLAGRSKIARSLVDRHGADCVVSVPGLVWRGDRGQWSLAGPPGLLIPCTNPAGAVHALQIRPDADPDSRGPKYLLLSSAKHGGASPGAPVHLSRPTEDRAQRCLRITEGWLKAQVACALSGVATAGLCGITWRRALPLIEALEPAEVRLALDMDCLDNDHVAHALLSLAAAVRRQTGQTAAIETWDGAAAKGIDDALHAGLEVSVHRDQAARDWLTALAARIQWDVPDEKPQKPAISDLKILSIRQRRDVGTDTHYDLTLDWRGETIRLEDLHDCDIDSYQKIRVWARNEGHWLPRPDRKTKAQWDDMCARAWPAMERVEAQPEETKAMEIRHSLKRIIASLCQDWDPAAEPEPRGIRAFHDRKNDTVYIPRGQVTDLIRQQVGLVSRVALRRAEQSLGWVREPHARQISRVRCRMWRMPLSVYRAIRDEFQVDEEEKLSLFDSPTDEHAEGDAPF